MDSISTHFEGPELGDLHHVILGLILPIVQPELVSDHPRGHCRSTAPEQRTSMHEKRIPRLPRVLRVGE